MSLISLLLWISSAGIVAAILWYLLACNNHLDNIIKGKTYKQLLLLGTVVVLTLSYMYLWASLLIKDHSGTVLLNIYSWFSQTSGVDNVPEPFSLKIFSLIVSLTGSVVFSGLLISTFNNLIQRRITAVEEGKIRYRSLYGYDILIGANELTFSVVQFLLSNTKQGSGSRIVILSKHPAQEVRQRFGHLNEKQQRRMVVYNGNICEEQTLKELKPESCHRIVILGDDPICKCDSGNILILDQLIRILEEKSKGMPAGTKAVKECYLSYCDDSFMLNYFQDHHAPLIHLYPFNFYENWATKIWGYGHLYHVLKPRESFQYFSLTQGQISPTSDHFVNLIILGFNHMGMELLKTAIKICHYANFDEASEQPKTRITVISDETEHIHFFQSRYSGISHLPDIEYTFIEKSPYDPGVRTRLPELVNHPQAVSTIAICSDDADRNYTLATHLPVEIYEKKIPIVAEYHLFSEYFGQLHADKRRYTHLRFFGFRNTSADIKYNLEVAQFIHKALDHLYDQKAKGHPTVYTALPDLVFTKEEIKATWHRYKIDNKRQTLLAQTDALMSMLDSMGLELVEARNRPIEEYTFELLGTTFDHIRHRQMIAWNLLAGYLPTDHIADPNHWETGKVNILFPLSKIRKDTKRYKEVKDTCHFQQISHLLWLYTNKYYLKPKGN